MGSKELPVDDIGGLLKWLEGKTIKSTRLYYNKECTKEILELSFLDEDTYYNLAIYPGTKESPLIIKWI